METYKINTTAFEEEDFFLMTDLTRKQVIDIINPIIELERNEEQYYTNSDLVEALSEAYPNNIVKYYYELKTITL